MKDHFEDPKETVWISIPLDAETAARLLNLSNFCQAEPVSVAASLLHDVLKDDEEVNVQAAIAVGTATIN